MTVRELLAALEAADLRIGGRPSKTVSDALRWEIRRGRVRRAARSTYVTDRIPPSTVRFIRGWLTDQDIVWEHYGAA